MASNKPLFNGGFPIGSEWPEIITDLMADVNNGAMRSVETACKKLDHPRAWKQNGTPDSRCYCGMRGYK